MDLGLEYKRFILMDYKKLINRIKIEELYKSSSSIFLYKYYNNITFCKMFAIIFTSCKKLYKILEESEQQKKIVDGRKHVLI